MPCTGQNRSNRILDATIDAFSQWSKYAEEFAIPAALKNQFASTHHLHW